MPISPMIGLLAGTAAVGAGAALVGANALKKKGGSAAPTTSPPAPIPPVSQTSQEVYDATLEARKMAMRRKGTRSTILGGETNSGTAYQSAFGQKTLLGG